MYTDNISDISCNRLSALFDRANPKDWVDSEIIPFIEGLRHLLSEKPNWLMER